jgi:hypothetical protein
VLNGTSSRYLIDPVSYSEVDIVDFAPRAISGTPAWSNLGLYLDVAQENFAHGFGHWKFDEPASYANTGHLVDTRFGHIQLWNNHYPGQFYIDTDTDVEENTDARGSRYAWQDFPTHPNISPTFGCTIHQDDWLIGVQEPYSWETKHGGLVVWYKDGTMNEVKGPILVSPLTFPNQKQYGANKMVITNGEYFFYGRGVDTNPEGRALIGWIGEVESVNAGTGKITLRKTGSTEATPDPVFDTTNLWGSALDGFIWQLNDSAHTTYYDLTSSDTTSVTTNTAADAGNFAQGDFIILLAYTGVTANAPRGMGVMATYGAFHWAAEAGTNYLHFWSELDGIDFEGNGKEDTEVIEVGPKGGNIVNLQVFNNQLWVFRPDGAWVVGEDHNAYHTLDYSAAEHHFNFRTVEVHQGFMYYTVLDKLYKYKSGVQDVTPPAFWQEAGDSNHAQYTNIMGLNSRGKFLYCTAEIPAAVNGGEFGPSINLLAYDGVGWHHLYELAPQDDTSSYVSQTRSQESYEITRHGVYCHPQGNRMYVFQGHYGTTDDPTFSVLEAPSVVSGSPAVIYADMAADTYVFPLPEDDTVSKDRFPVTGLWTSGTYTRYPGYWYSSWYDFGMARIPKSWRSVTVEGEFPTTTVSEVDYATSVGCAWRTSDDDAFAETMVDATTGASVAAFEVNLEELLFPTGTEGYKMQLKLMLRSEYWTITPVVRVIILKGMMRPDVLYGVSTDIIVANDLSDHRRKILGLTANEIRTRLKEARASVSPVTFTDLHGDSTQAYLASLRFIVVEYEDESVIEEIARVTFVNV